MKPLIVKLLHLIIPKLISLLSKFHKKDNKLVLFGSMNGLYYGDNSKHLYEYLHNNRPDLKPIWLTKNKEVFHLLNSQNKPVLLMQSFKGFRILLHAKCGLFSNGLYDLAYKAYLIPDNLKLIALRHGRSVKKVRFARKVHKISKSETIERKRESQLIQHAISTSEFISDIQEQCLLIGRNKHEVTGYPRNDLLFSPPKSLNNKWDEFLNGLKPKFVILYGPSWRTGVKPTQFFPFEDFNQDELISYLEKNQILLLLRPHVNDLRKYSSLRLFLERLDNQSNFIRFASHNVFPDVNTILPYTDILISDYSALYHDFLLLDKPIILIPYDYEEFNKWNGFLYDYFKNLPGKAVYSFNDFIKHIDLLVNSIDPFEDRRHKLRSKIHKYLDSNSCYRVSILIDKVLGNN